MLWVKGKSAETTFCCTISCLLSVSSWIRRDGTMPPWRPISSRTLKTSTSMRTRFTWSATHATLSVASACDSLQPVSVAGGVPSSPIKELFYPKYITRENYDIAEKRESIPKMAWLVDLVACFPYHSRPLPHPRHSSTLFNAIRDRVLEPTLLWLALSPFWLTLLSWIGQGNGALKKIWSGSVLAWKTLQHCCLG